MEQPLFIGSEEFGTRIGGTVALVAAIVVVICGKGGGNVRILVALVMIAGVMGARMSDPAADAERRSDGDRPERDQH